MKTKQIFFMVLCCLFFSTACSNDDDDQMDQTVEEQVTNFVSQEILDELAVFGFNFTDGDEALDFSGSYTISPAQLVATNIANDSPIGTIFSDVEISISNINFGQRTFTYVSEENNGVNSVSSDTFFNSDGNLFNFYAKVDISNQNVSAVIIHAYSGVLTDEGITDLDYALILLEKDDDPQPVFIAVGQGRMFTDGNNLASRVE